MDIFDILVLVAGIVGFMLAAGIIYFILGLIHIIIIQHFIPYKYRGIVQSCLYIIISPFVFWYLFDFVKDIFKDLDVFTYTIYSMIGIAIVALIDFIMLWQQTPICPECGTWFDNTILDTESDSYLKEEAVQRDVYNNSGEKIGHFNDTKISIGIQQTGYYKCNRCGKEYMHVTRH